MSDPERGATTISDRVVARIATQAAREAGESAGRTEVWVSGDVVTAHVKMSVPYPMPVRAAARKVRERIRGRVAELTGLTVRQVDVDVAELRRSGPGERTVR